MESILQKLHKDPDARQIFQNILLFLGQTSTPSEDLAPEDIECLELEFMQQLDALIQFKRQAVQEGQVKIGHWCTRESEKLVESMRGWPLYWLSMTLTENLPIHDTHPAKVHGQALRYTELDLSLWAEGHDDNTIQKGIMSWMDVHFPAWEVKSLKCVRR